MFGLLPQLATPQVRQAASAKAAVWLVRKLWQPHLSTFIFSPKLRRQFFPPRLRRRRKCGMATCGRHPSRPVAVAAGSWRRHAVRDLVPWSRLLSRKLCGLWRRHAVRDLAPWWSRLLSRKLCGLWRRCDVGFDARAFNNTATHKRF